MTQENKKLESEAAYWDAADIDLTRRVSWNSIRKFEVEPVRRVTNGSEDLVSYVAALVPSGLRGLALACGDLTGEYPYFEKVATAGVDAYDISVESFKRFQHRVQDPPVPVQFHERDVNDIKLPRSEFGFAIVVHAFHHFEAIEHVAREVSRSLVDDGCFLVIDYIGPNKLQYSQRQLAVAEPLFRSLPCSYRRDHTGNIRESIHLTPPDMYPPYEAIRSEEILDVLENSFDLVSGVLYGGLLYPLFEGIAFNFDEENSWDRWFIEAMWSLDGSLCASGLVEPNFCILVLRPKRRTRTAENSWAKIRHPLLPATAPARQSNRGWQDWIPGMRTRTTR